jgi:GNAT superfamily N-acetyltransferase
MEFEIRRPRSEEFDLVHALVSEIVNETYGDIWPTNPIPVGAENWGAGWVAAAPDSLLGWMLTQGRWLDDLWISHRFHKHGIGSALLAHAEREIAAGGIATAHLHVIASNERAIAFYERRGWKRLREIPHETVPVPRLEMTKIVG